ncbi:MAG TPA: hypothetical protein VKW04_11800 [Planctomycetota bacterium]|nr:hypothetical protein [Planctomycetota bacterium]
MEHATASRTARGPARLRLWIWGAIHVLFLAGLTVPLWNRLNRARTILLQLEEAEVSLPTAWTFAIGPYVWIPSLIALAAALELLRRGRRDAALTVFLASTIGALVLQATMYWAISDPLVGPSGE